jgi:hypothetical protein
MTVTVVIILVVIFLAAAMYTDSQRRKTADSATPENTGEGPALMADEAMTTQTGRFRVREMLKKTERSEEKDTKENGRSEHSEDDEPLPDPFNKSSH